MWRIYLHDWAGAAIGEVIDAHNVKLSLGLNKNPSLTFDTTLLSPLGKQLADRDFSLVSAYRFNPYTDAWQIVFSGMIFTTEETGSDDNPTIGISAIGPYWRLSKRIANDSSGAGKKQAGLNPTSSTLYLLVADRTAHRVFRFNAKTGALVSTIGSGSLGFLNTGDGQFNTPTGVAVGPDNFFYVVDSGNRRIQKFSPSGTFVKKWGSLGSGNTQFNAPTDIAVDARGDLWITDTLNSRIVKYDKEGNYLLKVTSTSTHQLNNLQGISADDDGFIYACSDSATSEQAFYKIDSAGNILSNSAGRYLDLERDTAGGYYLVGYAGNVWKSPKPNLNKLSPLQKDGKGRAVVVGRDKSIFISNYSASPLEANVKRYDAAGNLTRTIGTGVLSRPAGLALSRADARDAIAIASELISNSNSIDGNSWMRPASVQGTSSLIHISAGSWGGYKKITEAIEELSASFEWTIRPKMETDGTGLVLGEFYANSVIGQNKSNLVTFEYGVGRFNADSYAIRKSLEGLANRAAYPAAENQPYVVSAQSSSSVGQIGVFEEVLSGSLLSQALRKRLVDFNLKYRTTPRTLVEITPARSDESGKLDRRVPIPMIDYSPGDIVGIQIEEDGTDRVPLSEARIYDIEITVDQNGVEQAKLNLYLEAGAS